MREKKTTKRRSIFVRLLLPMLLIVLVEMLLLFLTLSVGGAFTSLKSSALDALDERTENKQLPLQQQMQNILSDLGAASQSVTQIIESRLRAQGATAEDLHADLRLAAKVLEDAAPTLLAQFRQMNTTGMILVLDGPATAKQPGVRAGIYLRDTDPAADASDNRDVMLMRGPQLLSGTLGVSLNPHWTDSFDFSQATDPVQEFYDNPFQAALEGAISDPVHYGLWQGPFRILPEDSEDVITCSMPLITSDGKVLGVIGIDLTQSYLSNTLDAGEYTRSVPGCYALGLVEEDGRVRVAASCGQMLRQHFQQYAMRLRIDRWLDSNSLTLKGTISGEKVYATLLNMSLYPENAMNADDRWVIMGLQSEGYLLSSSRRFLMLMVASGAVALLVGIGVAIITSKGITRPVSRMVKQVRDSGNSQDLTLDRTGMIEIDELGDSIRRLSRDVHESAARLTTILHLTGMAVGVFEVKFDSEVAWCSSGFFQLLECEEDAANGENMPKTRLYQIMREKLSDRVDTDVWRYRNRAGQDRYIRRVQLQHRYDLLGAVMDVTSEMEDRRRIEHERDYDILTGLLNRRAFSRITEDLFKNHQKDLGIAAMIMMDLDNLKFVNDVYGHDCGDNYIRSFGEALVCFDDLCKCVRGRRSGDEFYVLLYGFDSKEACLETINEGWQRIMQQGIKLTDGQFYRFRCSGGIAFYPDDAKEIPTLIHYADFAMYKVKQGSKGVLELFDRSVYTEEAFLINAREALNQLIDKSLLHFDFQPIVNAHTGDIYGYELLMRPDVAELRNPAATLRIAKAQGLLHHIERLTWYEGIRSAKTMQERGLLAPDVHIFINSIANQVLDESEEEYIIQNYSDMLSRVMLEVTESEDNNMAYTQQKLRFIREHGGQVAIDDYGTGYNSEKALMLIDAQCVKVDISFVRNVDSDPDKQQLVRNLISYARRKNIMVLAEGVETRAEMETLISFGMDFLQGYYLGRPNREPADIPETVRQEILNAAEKTKS